MSRIIRAIRGVVHAVLTCMTAGLLIFGISFVGPMLFQIRPYVVLSGSMEPKILTGSVVWINQKDTDPEVGEIITYQIRSETGNVVCHRVVEQTEHGYITKGDANNTVDLHEVTKQDVIGTYLFHAPYLGYLMDQKLTVLALYAALMLVEYALAEEKEPDEDGFGMEGFHETE